MLQERVEQWNRQLVERGRLEGGSRVLARQLARRFGPLPEWAARRLGTASEADLDRWTDAVLGARTLEEVFAAPPSEPSATGH